MEDNSFQHQDYTNFEAQHAQECTHMNDTAFFQCPDSKKKKKNLPTDPPDFQAKGATNLSFLCLTLKMNTTKLHFMSTFIYWCISKYGMPYTIKDKKRNKYDLPGFCFDFDLSINMENEIKNWFLVCFVMFSFF